MTDTPVPDESAGDLQFHTAEPAGDAPAGAAHPCALCSQPVASTYYALGESMLCPGCAEQLAAAPAGSRTWRLARATLYGTLAGLLGAAVWFAIRRITNLEIGIVAIVVGLMVGGAVRKGSAGIGGRGYQVLAVLITYCSIAANYMPDIFEAFLARARGERAAIARDAAPGEGAATAPNAAAGEDAAAPANGDPAAAAEPAAPQPAQGEMGLIKKIVAMVVLLGLVFAFAMAMPFLAGVENLIGLLIIGFALWEAWKINARRAPPISGPYQLGPTPVPQPPG